MTKTQYSKIWCKCTSCEKLTYVDIHMQISLYIGTYIIYTCVYVSDMTIYIRPACIHINLQMQYTSFLTKNTHYESMQWPLMLSDALCLSTYTRRCVEYTYIRICLASTERTPPRQRTLMPGSMERRSALDRPRSKAGTNRTMPSLSISLSIYMYIWLCLFS